MKILIVRHLLLFKVHLDLIGWMLFSLCVLNKSLMCKIQQKIISKTKPCAIVMYGEIWNVFQGTSYYTYPLIIPKCSWTFQNVHTRNKIFKCKTNELRMIKIYFNNSKNILNQLFNSLMVVWWLNVKEYISSP